MSKKNTFIDRATNFATLLANIESDADQIVKAWNARKYNLEMTDADLQQAEVALADAKSLVSLCADIRSVINGKAITTPTDYMPVLSRMRNDL